MITSSQNPKIKLVRSLLGRSRERRLAGAFVAEGVRLIEEACQANWPFRFVLFSSRLGERGMALVRRLGERGVEVEAVDESLLVSISDTETPPGIIAVLDFPESPPPRAHEIDFALILDRIRDPGNLGTLLRTAAAAGVQAVFLSPETTDAFAPKVVRAGMGAHFRLQVYALDWAEMGRCTTGLQIYRAEAGGGRSCWEMDFRRPLALVIGSEAEGAGPMARRLAQEMVYIPMPGGVESLNAAVAGAILMFEVVRQRQFLRRS